MTPQDRMMREIEEHERWMRETCADPDVPNVERIKMRVRIAVGEEWLARRLKDTAPVGLSERTRQCLRERLFVHRHTVPDGVRSQAVRAARRRRIARLDRWAAGVGLAAAASVALWIGIPRWLAPGDDLPFAGAFEQYVADGLTGSLVMLDEDLTELESVSDAPTAWDAEDTFIDGLRDAIDDVVGEGGVDDDWS